MDDAKPFLFFLALLIGVVALCVWALMVDDRDKERARLDFMGECQSEHHSHFDCVQMWRVGENHDTTTVVPMPVYVGH